MVVQVDPALANHGADSINTIPFTTVPLTRQQLEQIDRIYFEKPGECMVLVGPSSAKAWDGRKIPLDGRHYKCAGTLFLKNGRELFANLRIQTHQFDFLERDSLWVQLEDTWYRMNEPELFDALGITPEEALPYTWLPDRPLDYHEPGPYPMDWYASVKGK